MAGAPPIDIVFLWVDGADPELIAAMRRHHPTARLPGRADELSGVETRYAHIDEIVYAVRSVRLFAPWIGKIHIVVADGQRPPAAALAVPDVHVVTHSQIMPADCLPTFASPSIEPFVHRLAGLSDVFIYGNDDCLFWNPTDAGYFVATDQLRLRGRRLTESMARLGARFHRGHLRIAHRTALLLFAAGFRRVFMPEHSFRAFRKTTCEAVWDDLGDVLHQMVRLKFRDDDHALYWQMLVDAYETKLHHPKHLLSFDGTHLSFAEVERIFVVRAYVRARLAWLRRSSRRIVCFNTIPPRWKNRMQRYFERHLQTGAICAEEKSRRSGVGP